MKTDKPYTMFPTWEQSVYNDPKLISEIIRNAQSPLSLLIKAQKNDKQGKVN